MKIKNHKLVAESGDVDIDFKQSPNTSSHFKDGLPDTIVLHYTAGSSLNSAVNWLTNKKAQASAHFVVGKNGKVVQLAPLNTVTWHAGRSRWKNRSSLNYYSVGIEIDNAGILEKRAGGYFTYFDKKIEDERVVLAKHKNRNAEAAWEAYTVEQLEAVEALCSLLIEKYNIKELVGHDDIAPDRKTDPGPAFPLQSLKDKILLGRKDEEGEEKPDTGETESQEIKKGIITANLLNIRSKPDVNAMKISDPLPRGTKVKILEKQGGWYKVNVDMEGWVSSRWVE